MRESKDVIPHPRAGQPHRAMLDYVTCMVVTALFRQTTSLTEAIGALRAHVDAVTGRPLSDDPLDVPHLGQLEVRMYSELVGTAARLELAYRYVQRTRQALDEAIARSTDVSRETDSFLSLDGEAAPDTERPEGQDTDY